MTKVFGIDVSKHQGDFNFKKAKSEGVKFVVIRGSNSTTKDIKFEAHYKNAKAQDLPVGVYLYTQAKNESEAKAEAEFLYKNCLKGKKFELPIYIDIEDKIQKKLSKDTNTAIVKSFCKYLEAKGYWCGIYASKSFFSSYLNDDKLQSYAHWVAQWAKECTYKGNDGVLGMWQFGGETNEIRTNKVAGVVCDQDYMLVDYPTLIKKAGKNGYTKSTVTTPSKAPTTVKKYYTVKTGDNLTKIAEKYGTTVNQLVKWNKIENKNLIHPGQKLRVK